jgi:hypothetical protein
MIKSVMSKLDVQKVQLALQEKIFILILTIFLALLGWCASNLATAPAWLLVSGAIALLILIAIAIKQYLLLQKLIKRLEHVE